MFSFIQFLKIARKILDIDWLGFFIIVSYFLKKSYLDYFILYTMGLKYDIK